MSLPKLEKIDWRVDIQYSSNEIESMSIPSLILTLDVQEPQTDVASIPKIQRNNIEMRKGELN